MASPTVAKWELTLRIIERRRELKLSGAHVASKLGFSRNHWSAIENGRALMTDAAFEALMSVLSFSGDDQQKLRSLDATSRVDGWWTEYSDTLDSAQAHLVGLEEGAVRIRSWESLFIPGLLQTSDYARALLRSDPMVSELKGNQYIEVRSRRQQRLVGSDAPQFSVIISEAALMHQCGGPIVQGDQLRHLLNVQQSNESVEIFVLPFTEHPGMIASASTLSLLDFASDYLPTIAWQESLDPISVVDDPQQFERLEIMWTQALRRCASLSESSDLIEQLAARLSRT